MWPRNWGGGTNLFFNFFWLHCVFVHVGFLECGEWGLLFIIVCGLLIVVASLAAQHGL